MGLIYTTPSGDDVNVMPPCSYDLENGQNKLNNFSCEIAKSSHCCSEGCFIYFDTEENGKIVHTEYGGIVDTISPSTEKNTVTYMGRTWRGMMQGKVLYLGDRVTGSWLATGDANYVIGLLMQQTGLYPLFRAPAESAGMYVSYEITTGMTALEAIQNMLRGIGAKLKIIFNGYNVIVSAVPAVDYSEDEEWDSSQISYTAKQTKYFLNHIVLGIIEEESLIEIRHFYQNQYGQLVDAPAFTGTKQIEMYMSTSSKTKEEKILEDVKKKFAQEFSAANTIDANFNSDQVYDIGDIVGVVDDNTGVKVSREISSKIFKVTGNEVTVMCKVGDK